MLAASICRDVHFRVIPNSSMSSSRVPRCLFGKPNSRDTVEMLQEALDMERTRFMKRWGVDPATSEDKENVFKRITIVEKSNEKSPKKRLHPYSRQTCIHDYWRVRKVCDAKKPLNDTKDTKTSSTN